MADGGNSLELALLHLAQTMGVQLPGMMQPDSTEAIINTEKNKETTSDSVEEESEEGELTDEGLAGSVRPASTKRALPVRSAKNPVLKRQAYQQPASFNGDVDAESLMRQKWLKPARKAKLTKSSPAMSHQKAVEKPLPKVPCRYWMEGKCSKGEACTFSHALKPNKTSEEARSVEVCRFHMTGTCLKAEQCLFSHDLSRVPCRYFHVKGECGAGAKCRFSHAPLDEAARHALFAENMGSRDPRMGSTLAGSETEGSPLSSTKPSMAIEGAVSVLPSYVLTVDPVVLQLYDPFGSPF